jgi:Fe-S-cluster containining protein
VPKCELLFIVQPYDLRYYHLQCKCKDPLFWCSVLNERLVACQNLSAAICRSIFQYVAVHQKDLLFAKDEERAAFIRDEPKEPVSLLGLVSGYALEQLKS